jgi:glycosyltransferase involved in cell wall biosynthesis
MPKVSVVIPTHNRAEFLRTAIQSVLKQTFQNFEIIVVDDASEDHTSAVIKSVGDARIRYVRHETHSGQGATRNAGLHKASGEYVALLDDDDEWLPEKLEKQVRVLDGSSSNVGMVYTGVLRIEASSRRLIDRIIPGKRGSLFQDLCQKNWIGGCSSVMVRRSCFEKVGWFDEELAAQADYDMWLRISQEFDIEYIREPLVFYIAHDNTISTNYESRIQGMEMQLRKYGSLFSRDPRNYSRRYFALGVYYSLNGNIKKGRDALLKAITLYPFALRPYYYLCLSLLRTDTIRKWQQFKVNRTLERSAPYAEPSKTREEQQSALRKK